MRDSFPFVPSERLRDPRYRKELLDKVEALISVLQVAHQKVLRNLAAPGSDVERLQRICSNLEGTLEVCRRARRTLLQNSPPPASDEAPCGPHIQLQPGEGLRPAARPAEPGRMSWREYLELASVEEYRRLQDRGPITRDEVENVDLDELCRRLSESGLD